MKVLTYVIATDAGSAPNYDAPCLTLAICKPKIRLAAVPGALVLAFNGAGLGTNPNGVRWAGIVSEKLSFTDYWQDPRFANKKPDACSRPDNIYEPAGLEYRQIPNAVHGPASASRDLGGRYVLTFEERWYFGNKAPVLPSVFGLWMMPRARRGHRVANLSATEWEALRQWLDSQPQGTPPITWNAPGPKPRAAAVRSRC